MSGKQSVKPRLGGVCFFVRQKYHYSAFNTSLGGSAPARDSGLQRGILWVHHILKQRAQQSQRCLLTLHIATDQPHF